MQQSECKGFLQRGVATSLQDKLRGKVSAASLHKTG
jgi:hypothetical protein